MGYQNRVGSVLIEAAVALPAKTKALNDLTTLRPVAGQLEDILFNQHARLRCRPGCEIAHRPGSLSSNLFSILTQPWTGPERGIGGTRRESSVREALVRGTGDTGTLRPTYWHTLMTTLPYAVPPIPPTSRIDSHTSG